ncbi:MAG: DUF3040 domain-containing protein [Actinomycetota bacterium]|nr:DUF3040 domain-containing protein [Actinomycetota bacterium]
MSTRDDATLSAEERAAFARIEAQAIADDPSLGASLLFRFEHKLRRVITALDHRAHRAWVGALLIVVGVGLVVAGLATTMALSVLGLVAVVAGTLPVADLIHQRVERAADRVAAARKAGTAPPDAAA